ncbi:hypothetical protein NDI44_18930 [Trichocoleus sp. DQ-A3]|uniref:hypothetical protein n=1 Tax=Coleofasciculus sp. FACHB-125 TaxID=2692784 RepID=UPI0016888237|nr:hypothetical protein [Coleofasciculus sp. FACHB-125]MBD1901962.1 hypothetical protein [Coleofasciculus sp. FACHB-125]
MPYFDPIPKFYQIGQEVIVIGHGLPLPYETSACRRDHFEKRKVGLLDKRRMAKH